MPCTIVVGGQFGSEGKGKVTAFLASRSSEPWVVRCGGPNAGHSILFRNQLVTLRHIPAGVASSKSTLLLCAGCVIDERVLLQEIETLEIAPTRLIIDPMAVLIDESDIEEEKRCLQHVSSTFSGTGWATMRRIARGSDIRFAADSKLLKDRARVESVAPLLHEQLDVGRDVIIEGTQGFGLSLLHGTSYPCVTSRDTTSSGCLMETGVSFSDVKSVVVVIRTLPIRVGVNGRLPDEIDWDRARSMAGAPLTLAEQGSVTGRPRRVGLFDARAVTRACRYNGASMLAVMGMDRLDHGNLGVRTRRELTSKAHTFLATLHTATGIPVNIIGTGPGPSDLFWAA